MLEISNNKKSQVRGCKLMYTHTQEEIKEVLHRVIRRIEEGRYLDVRNLSFIFYPLSNPVSPQGAWWRPSNNREWRPRHRGWRLCWGGRHQTERKGSSFLHQEGKGSAHIKRERGRGRGGRSRGRGSTDNSGRLPRRLPGRGHQSHWSSLCGRRWGCAED